MRLTFSEYLARVPDRATNMFLGDAPLDDTSPTAGMPFLALWQFVKLASSRECDATIGHEWRDLGGEGGVESECTEW